MAEKGFRHFINSLTGSTFPVPQSERKSSLLDGKVDD